MKRTFKALCMAILTLLCFNTIAQTWPPAGMLGTGTQNDPWQLTTAAHLIDLSTYGCNQTNGHYFKLMNDIILSYSDWTPIGNYGSAFQGNFNGNGKVIQNLVINNTAQRRGLFGFLAGNATITNLGVENCNVTGGERTGGLIAEVYSGTTTISNCYVTGAVTGTTNVGGLVGYVNAGATCNITNCYTTCNVTGTGSNVGGITGGEVGNYSIVTNISYCYAAGTIKGNSSVGGIIGRNTTSNTGVIKNCVAANDSIIATSNTTYVNRIGNVAGNLLNNYALNTMVVKNSNGIVNVTNGSPAAGTAKTLAELQSLSFYTTSTNWQTSSWDIADPSGVWKICDNQCLPFLRYQNIACSFTITPTAGEGGSISPNTPQTVTAGTNLTFTAIPNNCKEVDAWYLNGGTTPIQTGGTSYTITNIQDNGTIHVTFKTKTFTVTPSAEANGSISPNTPQTVNCGENITFTAIPNEHYIVHYWRVDGIPVQMGGTSHTIADVQENRTINVDFEYVPQTFTVTFNAKGRTGSRSPQPFTEGVPQALYPNLFDKPGWMFKNWNTMANGNGTTYQNGQTITVSGNMTLFAQWEELLPNEYVITASCTAGGNIEPKGSIKVIEGSNQTFTFSANVDFEIDQALIDGVHNETAKKNGYHTFSNIKANHTIHVTFKPRVSVTEYETSVLVYPNPVTDVLTIKSDNILHCSIALYDISGRLVLQIMDNYQNETQVNISHLVSGIYVLRIGNQSIRILKE